LAVQPIILPVPADDFLGGTGIGILIWEWYE